MPVIKLKHIVSFSSEDKVHKADNLLKENHDSKWRCASPGEAQASVVIQLEKASSFSSIDIGNDGSAFVEVLVSRSSGEETYKVLLVASSFMSMSESRSGTGANRVRMFDSSKLSLEVMKEKWDRVKIVCTQPFNKHSSYGLRFITLHSPEDKDDSTSSVSKEKQPSTKEPASGDHPRTSFGGFKLKQDTSDKPSVSFFKKSLTSQTKAEPSIDIEKLKRKNAAKATSPPEKKTKLNDNISSASSVAKKTLTDPQPVAQKMQSPSVSSSSRAQQSTAVSSKRNSPLKKKENPKSRTEKRAFSDLLNDVVIVLSGYQNPERGEIRDKAIMMGAQYRKDWSRDCTHLICAFVNTPKYHQVIGTEGRIVKAEWITDCYSEKKRLPIKPYNIRPDYQSDDEVKMEAESEEDFDPSKECSDEDSSDTEDEVQRIFKKRSDGDTTASSQDGDRDIYDESTDEETEDDTSNSDLKDLPEYFKDIEFFLYGRFEPGVERLLKRHILTCDGTISNYMSDDVKYVVTESSWQQDFDDALGDNPNLMFVRPLWVFRCGQEKQLLPHQPFAVPTK